MIIKSRADVDKIVRFLSIVRADQDLTVSQTAQKMDTDRTVVYDLERRGTNSIALLARYASALGIEIEINLIGGRGA